MNRYKRVMSLFLASVMVVSAFTIGVFATDDTAAVAPDNNAAPAQEAQGDVNTDAPTVDEPETVTPPQSEAPASSGETAESVPAANPEGTATEPGAEAAEPEVAAEEPEVEAAAVDAYLRFENKMNADSSNYTTNVVITKGSKEFGSGITGVTLVEKVTSGTGATISVDVDQLDQGVTVTGMTAGKAYEVKINDTAVGTVCIPAKPADLMVGGKTAVEYKAATESKLTWKAVADAAAYDVYKYNGKSKTWSLYKTVPDTSCTDTVTDKDIKFTYKVYAVYEDKTTGSAIDCKLHSVASNSVTVINRTAPGTVTNLKGQKYKAAQYSGTGDSKVISPDSIRLTWNKVSGATSYNVYRYDNHTKKYAKIKNTTATSYTNMKLKNGYKYSYKVKAVKGQIESDNYSKVAGSYTISYHTSGIHAIWYQGVITGTAKCFSSKTSKSVVKKLGKGTKVRVLQRANGRSQILTSSGKVYWVNRSKCHYTAQIYNSKKDWTTAAKERYVKNYASKTKYLIFVSQYTQRVNVFKGKKGNWKLIKTGLCATGKIERKTPMGVFKVFQKEKGWFYSTHKNTPVVHFAARNSFHSRPTSYSGKVLNKTIGKPASLGCVRMEQGYVNWIYKYVPLGTKVISR